VSEEARDKAGDPALRERLVDFLDSQNAHAGFDRVVAGLPAPLRNRRPQGSGHSCWDLLEHLRLAQKDILEFSRDPDWVSPAWPEGYWPGADGTEASESPIDDATWDRSVATFRSDLEEMKAMVLDTARDLYAPFPWGDGQTLLRQALLVIDHNAYHLGQMVDVRRLLGAWPPTAKGG